MPQNINRTKMIQQKRNHLKKHVTRLMVLKNWHPMIFSMEKKVPYNASIHQIDNKGFSNAKRHTKNLINKKNKKGNISKKK